MEEKLILESLSPMERNVIPTLVKDFLDVEEVSEKSDLDKTTVLRAVGLLEKKGLVKMESAEIKQVDLGILGVNYLKKDLPERVLLNKLSEKGSMPIGEIKNACGLNDNEAKGKTILQDYFKNENILCGKQRSMADKKSN